MINNKKEKNNVRKRFLIQMSDRKSSKSISPSNEHGQINTSKQENNDQQQPTRSASNPGLNNLNFYKKQTN